MRRATVVVWAFGIISALGCGGGGGGAPAPELSIDSPSIVEGDSGTTALVFTVSLSDVSNSDVTVDYVTSDGTATTVDNDYTPASGTLTIPAGNTSGTISVAINGDTMYETDETILLTLSNPIGAVLPDTTVTATGTITNDDQPPVVSITDFSDIEGDSGPREFTFTVALSAVSGLDTSVDYATGDGTAVAASGDYESASGTITIPAGQTSAVVTVDVYGDMVYEQDETFSVTLSNPVEATLGTSTATGTILNDDPEPAISVSNVSASEGDSGTTDFVFTVTLSESSDVDAVVHYMTVDGTAVAGEDYVAAAGLVTIPAGSTSATITVAVNGDVVYEADEYFSIDLTDASDAFIADGTGTGAILNDDPVPSISISDASVAEGDSGTAALTFVVSLSDVSGSDVVVNYATSDGTATTSDGDYSAVSGTLIIPAGLTSTTITVNANGDTTYEYDETFSVTLSNPVNATISDDTGVGTILNDDSPPQLDINDVLANEGDSGSSDFTFTVSLSAAAGVDVSVDYTTHDGTATTADGDYSAVSGTLTIPAGQTSATIAVSVNGDTTYENDESFFVMLSNPVNATIGDSSGAGLIYNDDAEPLMSIDDVSMNEGDSGSVDFIFTVSLSQASGIPVGVDYATSDGTATTTDGDYSAVSGTLTIPAGQTSATIAVSVNGDTVYEHDETFFVTLSNPVNATLSDDTGVGTIVNDEPPPELNIHDASDTEGNSGTKTFYFNVWISTPVAVPVSVDYATSDGTATTADGDYESASGTITIPAGQTYASITVTVYGDTKYEPDEVFYVDLSNAVDAVINDGHGVGTIYNDE